MICMFLNVCLIFCIISEGVKPKMSEDAFEDLLGGQSFAGAKKSGPKTIKDMRKDVLAENLTPEQLAVSVAYYSLVVDLRF